MIMSAEHETVEFEDVTVQRETDHALYVIIPDIDDDDPITVPKSVISEHSDVKEIGDAGTLVVRESWAKKKSLI